MSPGTGGSRLIEAFLSRTDSISAITWQSSIVTLSPRLKISKGAPVYLWSPYALDDVIDVGKIASCGAIAVKVYWLIVIDEIGEFVYSQVGTSAWSVDGEKAQAGCANFVKMGKVGAEMFTSDFGCREWAQGLGERLIFPERNKF